MKKTKNALENGPVDTEPKLSHYYKTTTTTTMMMMMMMLVLMSVNDIICDPSRKKATLSELLYEIIKLGMKQAQDDMVRLFQSDNLVR